MLSFCKKFKLFCVYKITFLVILLVSFVIFWYFDVFNKNTIPALLYFAVLIIINFLITPYIILEETRRFKKIKKKLKNGNK
jgi:hypothetical protein